MRAKEFLREALLQVRVWSNQSLKTIQKLTIRDWSEEPEVSYIGYLKTQICRKNRRL